MKIFDKEQIYKADKETIQNQEINSDQLMERAAEQLFNWINTNLKNRKAKLHIFCGIGNNGGDGLALARMLHETDYNVAVYIVDFNKNRSKDFLTNLDRIKQQKLWPDVIDEDDNFPEIKADEIIIDAIFGIGLNRPAENWLKDLIVHINRSKAYIISVDIPSGLYLDDVPKDKNAIIKANYTLTFQVHKLIFFLPETAPFIGNFQVLNIGLDDGVLAETKTDKILISLEEARSLYRPRSKFSHKGIYGHCLIIGGSYGKIGSIILATKAALKIGAGKLTGIIPRCGYSIFQTAVPEAMVITDENENYLQNPEILISAESICIGPGLGTEKETANFLEAILKRQEKALLIDADGLNILSKNKKLLELLPEKSILTPHPKELERLIGKWKNDFEKLKLAKEFSKKYKIILVIKGAYSITIAEEMIYVNTSGNSGMATAGSGDVLSGVISGLLAQQYDPAVAAVFGVYLHGKAGDLALANESEESLLAGDIILNLGKTFKHLLKSNEN
ncbi:NAD(P)H-hydrate dehydratase [Mesonia aquimarina]|uniref:NAD(P)H-hydrate dehydratase n=1 Tax=Mesonia aquimarina TaxID=1504967 RepID=UPI000EF59FB8|nr:NAD(P)H-hydrate dehydratase [Mesonia aquimarina]